MIQKLHWTCTRYHIKIVYPKNNVQAMKSHWRTKLQKPASEGMLFSLKSTVSLLTLALLSTLWYSFNRKDGNEI